MTGRERPPAPHATSGSGSPPTGTADTVTRSRTARTTLRRLITVDGTVLGATPETLIRARDGHRCAAPYCDAPTREIDHIHRRRHGGATTFGNGRGPCTVHNQAREPAGRASPAAA